MTCKYYSAACGIEVPNSDQLVITGGHAGGQDASPRVQVYTVGGAKKKLPDLNQPRYAHACGYFFNGNKLVKSLIIYIILLVFSQVYLVTGGDHQGAKLDSTELLTKGASAWVYSGVLPSAGVGLRASTLDNRLIVTGR